MEISSGTIDLIQASVGAAATIAGAASQFSAAGANAGADKGSAKIAEQQAAARADAIRRDAVRLRGAQRAATGGSGVTLNGSAWDVMEDSAYEAELDALTASYEGDLTAGAFRKSAASEKRDGAQAVTGGVMGAGAKALQGYGAWKRYQESLEPGKT